MSESPERPESIAFDRAADYYDRTRTVSPEAMRATIEMLVSEIGGRTPCLEIGVGTGRIAVPLEEAGVPVVGLDLSRPMLAKARGKSRDLPLVEADATALPVAAGAFGSAIGSWVLHLVADIGVTVSELMRAVRPGGIVLISYASFGKSVWTELTERFAREAGAEMRRVTDDKQEAIDDAFASRGARVRRLPPIENRRTASWEEMIGNLEAGLYSWTWTLDEHTRRSAGERVRAWAEKEFGPLDETRDETRGEILWRAYDILG